MNHKNILLIVASVLFSMEVHAQGIISSRKLGKLDEMAVKYLDEVNARAFKPNGYDTVMNPKLPDSLSNLAMLSKEERAEMLKKRVRFNPYLVFGSHVELKKGDILVNSLAMEAIRLAQSTDSDQAKEKLVDVLKIDSNNVIAYRHLILMSPDENDREHSWRF